MVLATYIAMYITDVLCRYIGGIFGNQPANEYCLTLSNANVTFSVGFNSRYALVYSACFMSVGVYIAICTYVCGCGAS